MMWKVALVILSVFPVSVAGGFCANDKEPGNGDWRFVLNRPAVLRPISPRIYGMAAAPKTVLRKLRVPLEPVGRQHGFPLQLEAGKCLEYGQ